MKNFALFACLLWFTTIAFAGPITINFETDGLGHPTFSGEPIALIYSNLGATFTNGLITQCVGGCPAPAFGHFASSVDGKTKMRVDFSTLQSSVYFYNIQNSHLLAQAFNSSNALVASNSINSFLYTGLNGAGIAYVIFQSNDGVSSYGIDNLFFDGSTLAAIPEPTSLFLLVSGLLGGFRVLRRRTELR